MAGNEDVLMQLVERSARQDQRLISIEDAVKQLVETMRELMTIESRHIQMSAAIEQSRQDVTRLFELYHEQLLMMNGVQEKIASSEPMSKLTTRIVFGMMGTILTAVLIAIIATVIRS